MINYYFDSKTKEDALVIDINQQMYIVVMNYSEWIAEDPKDYNYKDADYFLVEKPYHGNGTLLNDNEIFLSTLKHDGKNLYRNVVKEVLK